jgi:hypothetical protein
VAGKLPSSKRKIKKEKQWVSQGMFPGQTTANEKKKDGGARKVLLPPQIKTSKTSKQSNTTPLKYL